MVPREIAFHSQHLGKFALDSRWLTFCQKSEPFLLRCSTKANCAYHPVSLTLFKSGKRIEKEKTS